MLDEAERSPQTILLSLGGRSLRHQNRPHHLSSNHLVHKKIRRQNQINPLWHFVLIGKQFFSIFHHPLVSSQAIPPLTPTPSSTFIITKTIVQLLRRPIFPSSYCRNH